jgi:hypothetical protein
VKSGDFAKPWYRGSPFRLSVLRKGSTITQDQNLARVFSHKPTIVSLSDGNIKHYGNAPGFLYRIAESLKREDVYPHPRSSMPEGKEWVTARELAVEPVGPTQIVEDERLTEEEATRLKEFAKSRVQGTVG